MSLFSSDDLKQQWPSDDAAGRILERLSGFQKYPPTAKGREVFREALLACESEGQAVEVIGSFDESFPTLKELRDVIYTVKTKSQNEQTLSSQKAKWEADGCTYDPEWAANLAKEIADLCSRKAMTAKPAKAESAKTAP